jgi:hypothetical protein
MKKKLGRMGKHMGGDLVGPELRRIDRVKG